MAEEAKDEVAGTGVLESAEWVVARSENTAINEDGIDKVAKRIISLLPYSSPTTGVTPLSPWSSHPLHPPVPLLDAPIEQIDALLDWIFLVSVLNFSFWSGSDEDRRYAVEWQGERRKGYWSLLAALHRGKSASHPRQHPAHVERVSAIAEGVPVTSPSWYKNISLEDAASVFRSDTAEPIPLLAERIRVMREAGSVLCDKYQGHFRTMLESAKGSAVELVTLVVRELSSFRDEAVYDGIRVRLYKRAQILVAETWAAFGGRGPGSFADIDGLTMFADYRVPQILHSLQTVTYSPQLTALLESHADLPNGCPEEVELRAASIVAVERLRRRLEELILFKDKDKERRRRTPTAVELDFWLWDLAKEEEKKAREAGRKLLPHHRTRSCFY